MAKECFRHRARSRSTDTEAPGRFNRRDDTEDKNFKFLRPGLKHLKILIEMPRALRCLRTIEANILKEMTLKGIQGIKKA